MKKQLRNLALASALVIAGAASAQTLTDNFEQKVTVAAASSARYATGHNGKIYYADKGDNTVKSIAADGTVTTVLSNENIKGLGVTFDQAGNMIVQAGTFPNGDTSQLYLIATPNADGTFTAADDVVNFGGEETASDVVPAGRVDVLPQVIGDVTSEQGAIFYVCAQKGTSVYTVYFQNGGKGDYDNIGGYATSSEVKGLGDDITDNNTFAQPLYNSMDELMAAYEEGANVNNAFVVRKRGNAANAYTMVDDALTVWASADAFSTAGFAKFNLGGEEYAVFPTNIGSHTRNFQVVRVSDGEVMGKTNFEEVVPSVAQNSINAEVIDETTAYIYSGCSLGAQIGVAMATFTVSAPEPPAAGEVYFDNNYSGWDKVYAYCWDKEGNFNAAWPGVELTEINDEGYYVYTLDSAEWTNIIFNNGNGDQTADLTFTVGKVYNSVPEVEAPETLYIMGHIGSDDTQWWQPSIGLEMTHACAGCFEIQEVTIADCGNGNGYFSFVSTLGADWDAVNAGKRFGPSAADTPVAEGESVDFVESDKSWAIAAGVYDFKVEFLTHKLTVSKHSGIDSVEAAEGSKVYYNLQGVEVANPQNGLYIVKEGNKVSKKFIR